jgi:hypothetical protein
MKLSIADYHRALDTIHDPSGAEAAIVDQFARDLAVTARFGTIEPPVARQLLHIRIARHRAALRAVGTSVQRSAAVKLFVGAVIHDQ